MVDMLLVARKGRSRSTPKSLSEAHGFDELLVKREETTEKMSVELSIEEALEITRNISDEGNCSRHLRDIASEVAKPSLMEKNVYGLDKRHVKSSMSIIRKIKEIYGISIDTNILNNENSSFSDGSVMIHSNMPENIIDKLMLLFKWTISKLYDPC